MRERENSKSLFFVFKPFYTKYYLNHGLTIKKELYYIKTMDFLKANIADLLWKNYDSIEKKCSI